MHPYKYTISIPTGDKNRPVEVRETRDADTARHIKQQNPGAVVREFKVRNDKVKQTHEDN